MDLRFGCRRGIEHGWCAVYETLIDRLLRGDSVTRGRSRRPAADPKIPLELYSMPPWKGYSRARAGPSGELADGVSLAGGGAGQLSRAGFPGGVVRGVDWLLTESVTALVSEGLVELDEIVVDGTKVVVAGRVAVVHARGTAGADRAGSGELLERLRGGGLRSGSGDANVGGRRANARQGGRGRVQAARGARSAAPGERGAREDAPAGGGATCMPFGVADRSGSAADALFPTARCERVQCADRRWCPIRG